MQKITGMVSGLLSLCFFGFLSYIVAAMTSMSLAVGFFLLAPVFGYFILSCFAEGVLVKFRYLYMAFAFYVLLAYVVILLTATTSHQAFWSYETAMVIFLFVLNIVGINTKCMCGSKKGSKGLD